MRYMMFIKHPADYDISKTPHALFGPMGEFVSGEMKKGVIIDGAGLQPLAKGARVRLVAGKVKVTDGPFSEAKEVVGGYVLCEVKNRAEAIALATKFMDLHRTYWPDFGGECEVRPLEDMGPG